MKSVFLASFAVLLFVCFLFTPSNADTKLFRARRDADFSDDSITQKIQRELQSLQTELQSALPRNATNPLLPFADGDGDANSGLSTVLNFIVQAVLVIPKAFLQVGKTFTGIGNRIISGILNGLNDVFTNILNWLNTL